MTLSRQRAGPEDEEGKFALGDIDMKDFLLIKYPEISCSLCFFPWDYEFCHPFGKWGFISKPY